MRIFLISACIVLCLCGCLTFEHSLRFTDADGLLMGYAYSYSTEDETALKAGMEELGLAWRFYDEQSVRAYFAEKKLEVARYRKISKGGRTSIEISVMTRNFSKSLADGVFPEIELTRGKVNTLSMRVGEISPDADKRLKMLCPEFKASLLVSVPGTIRETNGRKISKDTATWEYTPGGTVVSPTVSW